MATKTHPILADEGAALVAKLPCYPILLLVPSRFAGLVPEPGEGHLGCQAVVGAEGPSAAVAVAERRACILGRLEVNRVPQPLADAAALHVDGHDGLSRY